MTTPVPQASSTIVPPNRLYRQDPQWRELMAELRSFPELTSSSSDECFDRKLRLVAELQAIRKRYERQAQELNSGQLLQH